MDRQKSIPPLSTKITRKLAQESADHNSLMNFYSQISRDETGAPKKWKMTSPLHIDEESITSGKTGKSPGRPRGRKSLKNGKKGEQPESSSSDRSSSRESSIDSKDKPKKDSRRSFSTGSASQISASPVDNKVVKKRGRPKSLDLSTKTVNGDDDNFKSPVPLTPCNIAVKRKKGRPKETPPVLVAETPLEDDQSNMSDSDQEVQIMPQKKKPGRKTKNLKLKTGDRFKTLSSLNRLDGHGLKKYGSKLMKTGFRPKLTKVKTVRAEVNDNNVIPSNDESESSAANMSMQSDTSDGATPKRKPGRPPGAKNKTHNNFTVALNAKRRAAKLNKLSNQNKKGPLRRGPGRLPGSKNKPKSLDSVPSDTSEPADSESGQNTNIVNQNDNEMDTSSAMTNGGECSNAIDEAIDAVVYKVRNNLPIEPKRDPFKANLFYKKRAAVKSIAKFKKERDALNKMRQKRLLAACGTKGKEILKDENLAKNDLRRKLQNKILNQKVENIETKKELEVPTKKSEWVTYKTEDTKSDGATLVDGPLESESGDNAKTEADSISSTVTDSCEMKVDSIVDSDKLPKTETNIGLQLEADQVNKVKKVFSDMTKDTDTDSVCSELSINSLSSMKRPFEKQILILGEDNTDSDDVTVRTRQRFEIIPGKKRKRTLSGEFDLLDEKQLRKEKKKAGKSFTDDESDPKPEPVKKIHTRKPLFKKRISPMKKSPTLKDGIVRKYTTYTAVKNRLKRQSPFLNIRKRRKRKRILKGKQTFDHPGSEASRESSIEIENSVMVNSKAESYRQGLFEKFTNDSSLDGEPELKEEIPGNSYEVENVSYEPEDESEYMPVEETVDDSDTIDFHSMDQEEKEESELLTESEIEMREILFGIIDKVIETCERKSKDLSTVDDSCETDKIKPNIESVKSESSEKESVKSESSELKDKSAEVSEVPLKSEKDEGIRKPGVNVVEESTVSENKEATSMASGVLVNEGNVTVEGKKKTIIRRKIKMGKRGKNKKVGPLPIARRLNALNPLSTAIRKKPGRKPGRKPKNKTLLKLATSVEEVIPNVESVNVALPAKRTGKATARKTSTSNSDLTNIGLIRKFELRQKISRSPLDNIALKQSIEENEYLKNEAQKAYRKEAKLKSKLKSVQDAINEGLELDYLDEDFVQYNEVGFEELLAQCKPCSVVLKDFIKELERAQGVVASESETDAAVETDEDIPGTMLDSNESLNLPVNNTGSSEAAESSKVTEISASPEATSDKQVNTVKHSEDLLEKTDSNETKDIPKVSTGTTTVTNSEEIKSDLKLKRKSPSKAKVSISPNKSVQTLPTIKVSPTGRPRGRPRKHKLEPQTARKTVPPLKIKLKGGLSSRRKTYMVEPHPDSPVELTDKSEVKFEKKKDKLKVKSGNKSESSDSEKHGKHHHHKKRNKTPTDEIVSAVKPVVSERVIKPTDAYEANFLQFIQDKDKVEQNIMAFSSSFNSKSKTTHSKTKEIEPKVVKEIAPKPDTTNSAAVSDKTVTPDKDSEVSDVQYVCSQCDDVVYRAKEQIIQHYNEVHPGLQFIYKPLSESSGSDDLRNMRMAGNAAIHEQHAAQKTGDATGTNNNQISEDVKDEVNDDDDSGSLNLKIIEVVSLKDQQTLLPGGLPMSTPQPQHRPVAPVGPVVSMTPVGPVVSMGPMAPMAPIGSVPIQPAELRIPTFPMFSGGAAIPYPGLTLVSRQPPPSYPVAAQLTPMAMVQPTIARPPQPQLTSPEPAKPRQAGKLGNTFKCDKCNVHAPMLAAMVAHLRSVHKDIPRLFQCPYCKDLEAETEALIHQHIKKTHPTNNPNPPVALSEPAKRNLKTLSVLIPEGMKIGEGNNIDKDIYMCLRCKTHMPSLDTIYDHLEKEHSEIFAYVCPVCKKFKSHSEDSVNNHIITEHRQSPFDVSVSLAIDGNHFTRVQCLIKERNKSGQKASQKQTSPSTATTASANIAPKPKPHISPKPNNQQENIVSALSIPPASLSFTHSPLSIPALPLSVNTSYAIPLTVTHTFQSPTSSIGQCTTVTTTKSSISQPVSKPATTNPPKKKKNLLESIEKLTVQKQLEQGIIPSKPSSSVSLKVPSHPSQLSSSASSSAPPPLLRAPPPLIRYDQLNKVTSAQSTILSSSVRTTSAHLGHNQGGIRSQLNMAMMQKLQGMPTPSVPSAGQSNIPAKPIKSSLFDTSDLESSITAPRPVLNVPVVPRLNNKSPSHQGHSVKSGGGAMPGTPLDLSKTTPSPSPDHLQSASPVPGQTRPQVIPDEFKVFNLKPSTQMQLPRPAVPVNTAPIMVPQQVRQNTPSTLAYRPPGPQINVSNPQMQQLISMPMGTVIGFAPNMAPIFGGPNLSQQPQLIHMSAAPQIAVSNVAVLASTPTLSAPIQSNQVKNAVASTPQVVPQPVFSRNQLFRCPYCPKLTPLKFEQVYTHIQTKHPGSQTLFMPFDVK